MTLHLNKCPFSAATGFGIGKFFVLLGEHLFKSSLGLKVVGVKSINLNDHEVQPPTIPLAKESVATSALIATRLTPVISKKQQVNTNIGIVFSIR